MASYRSSEALTGQLMDVEAKEGLNGALVLIHPGTEDGRTDKLYDRLEEIIVHLKQKVIRLNAYLINGTGLFVSLQSFKS